MPDYEIKVRSVSTYYITAENQTAARELFDTGDTSDYFVEEQIEEDYIIKEM